MIDKNGEPIRYMKGYRKFMQQFKEDYPNLCTRGMTYEPNGYMEIKIRIPGKGIFIYNPVGTRKTKLKVIERWVDEKEEKRIEREKRSDMYKTFLSMIRFYQKTYGSTQEDIAKLSGISRQSINKYLSGSVIPKVSTMRQICDSLDLDIDN